MNSNKLQSWNAQFSSKLAIFCPVWPSNLMDDFEKHQIYDTSGFVHHFIAINEFKLKLQSGNAIPVPPSNVKSNMIKANLRDLIAASSPVILLKLDSNRLFFSRCDLEIWWMTSKNNKALLLYYIKLCASFQTHWWIQTGLTVWKSSILVKIGDFQNQKLLV